jgi:hypothetical protein
MAAKKTARKSVDPSPAEAKKSTTKIAAKVAKRKPATRKAADPSAPSTESLGKKPSPRPSLDTIARAAYLNYRRRVEQGLPGNSQGDWLEAERQCNSTA